MSLFERWIGKLNDSIEHYADVDIHQQAAKVLDEVVEAAGAAHKLAVTGGDSEDTIAETKWRYDIALSSKESNASFLERSPKEVLIQQARRVRMLQRDYFEWCSEPRDAERRLGRYEHFWINYHSQTKEYAEFFHGHFIRICAYRLAALYADTANATKCKEMLEWLENGEQVAPQREIA